MLYQKPFCWQPVYCIVVIILLRRLISGVNTVQRLSYPPLFRHILLLLNTVLLIIVPFNLIPHMFVLNVFLYIS